MVLMLPKVPTFGERLGAGLGAGISEGIGKRLARIEQERGLTSENEAYPALAGLKNPELRKIALSETLKGQSKKDIEQTKHGLQEEMEAKDYSIIKERYGEKVADLWKAAPVGAKTNILDAIIEGKLRGMSVEEALGGMPSSTSPEKPLEEPESVTEEGALEEFPQVQKPGEKTFNFDKGLTPAEKVKREQQRYNMNLPLFEAVQTKQRTAEMEAEELGVLEDLSPKIGVLQRLNINPTSGNLLIPALASPEAQRFVKTVNDFTRLAKDSYGSRVTNFDLEQFMKRLPTLANSEEGRGQIIQQMKLINKINQAHDKSLLEVFDKHGGIRKIDFDIAQNIAEKEASRKIKDLTAQFKLIGKQENTRYENTIKERKKEVRKGFVLMEKDGKIGEVPQADVKEAIEDGAVVL